MSEQVFRNHGQLFEEAGLAEIASTSEWSAERSTTVRHRLEEALTRFELVREEMEEGAVMGELENQYHWVGAVLRGLGYTFSVAELTPVGDETVRPDFSLFYNSGDFRTALPHRGEREFFQNVIGVVRCLGWEESLDEYPEGHEGPANPAYEIDRIIRTTGVSWGIMTNGRVWRLYHRETSGLFSTFYEVDLVAALQSGDMNTFKYFWAIFSPEGLGGYDSQDPIVHRLLH